MYLEYWGFRLLPFENVPDPDFFYLSETHKEALTRLLYATRERKGGALLSGDIGCGKTTLTNVYVREISGNGFDIGLLINPKLEPVELLQEILYQLNTTADPPDTKVKCLHILNEKMLENMKQNKDTLLVIDEAQLLTEENLEEIRLLQNFQLNDRQLLTVVLVGQTELRNRISNMEHIDQRIAIRYHLEPFNLDDTISYIRFRLEKAGSKENVFDSEAMEKIYDHSGGVPRKINHLCDLALLLGFSNKEKMINSQIIEGVLNDGALC
jgi:type II secretory pathway predicted ATPase ExeA